MKQDLNQINNQPNSKFNQLASEMGFKNAAVLREVLHDVQFSLDLTPDEQKRLSQVYQVANRVN